MVAHCRNCANQSLLRPIYAQLQGAWPVVWILLVNDSRAAENQMAFLVQLIATVLSVYSDAAIVLDGFSFPIGFHEDEGMNKYREPFSERAEGVAGYIAELQDQLVATWAARSGGVSAAFPASVSRRRYALVPAVTAISATQVRCSTRSRGCIISRALFTRRRRFTAPRRRDGIPRQWKAAWYPTFCRRVSHRRMLRQMRGARSTARLSRNTALRMSAARWITLYSHRRNSFARSRELSNALEFARAAPLRLPKSDFAMGPEARYIGFSQLTIQCVPKRSVTMPKRLAQKVSAIAMPTLPPCDSAPNTRSACSGVSTLMLIA